MPNPYIDLTYDPEISKLQRAQRMADMLRQQSMQDIPITTAGGVPAPISPFSVLAKALQGYAAKKNEDKAEQGLAAYHDKDVSSAQALVDALTRKTNQVGTPDMAPGSTTVDATAPQLPGGQAPAPASASVALPGQQGTGMTQQGPDTSAQLAALLAAHGGPQTQMVQQAMLPEIFHQQDAARQQQMQRDNILWQQGLGLSEADKQRADLEKRNKIAEAAAINGLPMSAADKARIGLGYAQLNKPEVVGPMSNVFYPKTGKFVEGPGLNMGGGGPIDPNSNSLTAQTGLSQAALDYLTSDIRPRGNQMTMIQNEVTKFSRDHNIDTATLRAQAKAANNVVTQNVGRNNQSKILENELQGTIQTIAPLAQAIGQGQINIANLANVWAGKQTNDPRVQQYADQLLRLRSELAGYNAVAAGKLLENGTPKPDNEDFKQAEQVISAGINAGGLGGLAQSIVNTTAKNRAVLSNSLDDANQQMWSLFGVGQHYKRSSPPLNAAPSGTQTGRKTVKFSDLP